MKRATTILFALAVAAGSVAVVAQRAQPGRQGQSRFRALRGQAALSFAVPPDMRLTRQERVGAGGQILAERYQQIFGDAQVLGGQITVYRDDAGVRDAVIGAHYPNLVAANVVRLTADGALSIAQARRNDSSADSTADLLLNPSTGRYFYRVEIRSFDTRWFYWVDADTGAIVNEYDGLTTEAGTGTGVLGDTRDLTYLTTFNSSTSTYRMVSTDGRQQTYDAKNRNALAGTLATDADNTWDTPGTKSPGQPALVDAQFYANVTDDYYESTHAFNWISHYPQGIVSSAHVGRRYNNAYWNGTQMAYGDGDGSSFIEFSGALDVVGHELSHGVTEATSNLIYQNESGALNEAFSDIMGTAIEFSYGNGNWTIGEDITVASNGIRNMADPNEDGDPSHYADRYMGTSDNGGVHTNSGIANHWFYLLVTGGQNADLDHASGEDVQGIGLEAAAEIAFLGFTGLSANSNFCAAREGTIAVAGTHADNVADAWHEVGVDEALCNGGSGGGDPPTITNVTSQKLQGTKFKITWTTDVPATSTVTFTCCGTYSNSTLVTSHAMTFTGSNGVTYEYFVQSADAYGNATTAGPYVHQNVQ
jgi:bacillolysin